MKPAQQELLAWIDKGIAQLIRNGYFVDTVNELMGRIALCVSRPKLERHERPKRTGVVVRHPATDLIGPETEEAWDHQVAIFKAVNAYREYLERRSLARDDDLSELRVSRFTGGEVEFRLIEDKG